MGISIKVRLLSLLFLFKFFRLLHLITDIKHLFETSLKSRFITLPLDSERNVVYLKLLIFVSDLRYCHTFLHTHTQISPSLIQFFYKRFLSFSCYLVVGVVKSFKFRLNYFNCVVNVN